MRGAADRCMNIGVCRKGSTGVMCPSYMATREEEHSTRGRANALVQALSQPDPRAALGDERLHDILDLCLECKACKSECPLGVDMASMKSEFLFQYQDSRRPTTGALLRRRAPREPPWRAAGSDIEPCTLAPGRADAHGAHSRHQPAAAITTIPPADPDALVSAKEQANDGTRSGHGW